MSKLSEAIEFAERVHPLPRCEHRNALRDGAGEALEPPCGCRAKDARKLAERIVEKMFTNGANEEADRLVMFKAEDRPQFNDGYERPYGALP